MKNNLVKPLELTNIPYNFSIIIPVNGKDTLCIYNERIFALKSYGYFQSNARRTNSITQKILSKYLNDEKNIINHVTSYQTYHELNGIDNRESHLIFSWEGECDSRSRKNMESLFSTYSNDIYYEFQRWLQLEHKTSSSDLTVFDRDYDMLRESERNLEEKISILVYQAEKHSLSLKRKFKKTLVLLISFFIFYLIAITFIILKK
ncbi:hypothetical protein [Xenorhabdus bovienii]|uniref:hypothetical protein n=1 Tax=Xenorhabdus bovienii TaxID=40576 RepID=UPI0023B2E9F7|nr:hypothetical protein [Xenorhabdus bovienii]MDE9487229.1 hypothetical protein [Xenorhabdus bovienii]